MPTLTVPDLSEDAIVALGAQARQHGRSAGEEARAILEEHLPNRRRLLDDIERDVARQARPTTAEEVDEWIRETRHRPV